MTSPQYEKHDIPIDAIYIPTYSPAEYCVHSSMLKTAQFTSYRLCHASSSSSSAAKRASWINTARISKLNDIQRSRNIHSTPHLRQGPKFEAEHTKGQSLKVGDFKMAGNRKNEVPKHEMVHFSGLLNTERRFGDFRTVLHTGLYSQLVAMEVPVNGEIGDEVRF